ncbi:deoxyribodipyrimidine photo-lyase [Pseudodesulfovibrio piezophilus]|uniref:Deoxyribodipyrimidine photo-lyase n=1 Tax=Pseudodesulfovibrio piezophilus (strain DSM 21447 / JCM 15486 / C1TLV30) TaxID=1322246 RepID=M1WRN7_PSEP2|nr:deoxyribodipyrimidine photo-lyase [Pseudodesulfovibrio piezophilus]CCH49679.1 Deoxyribodipyrimidine photo-lyase [Pseudodesulfovibrio piezophilus C1TLV30]
MKIHEARIHRLNDADMSAGPILYWMSREQRVQDNWGLLHARELAGEDRPLIVLFCLVPGFLGATLRQDDFMLNGLAEVENDLAALGIAFLLRLGDPEEEVIRCVLEKGVGAVVTDFDPLRIKQGWQKEVASTLRVPLIEVDGHNVVPARSVSDKQEYAARTLRPKIHRLSSEFLEDFPRLEPLVCSASPADPVDWHSLRSSLRMDETVSPVALVPGESAAHAALSAFVDHGLHGYAERRNDPVAEATSRLSAFFHFGHLAPQRAALAVAGSGKGEGQAVYLEEVIVRRELSDNFCLYNIRYDSLHGAPNWALKTLDEHRSDPRPFLYSHEEFEAARTHSPLWNAAQTQLLRSGFMHGYMRMFWAKKILEWSPDPESAHATVVTLNDRYQLDGRDPNGYVGALWSVAGLHDRPWQTRPIYGSVRYMNSNGCRRKFDTKAYISRWLN